MPVRYAEFDSELAEREALIEFNRQREKTPGQIVNEFEEILEIEKRRAEDRQSHGETAPGKNAVGNVSQSDGPERARDKAAEKVNTDVSGRTLEKATSTLSAESADSLSTEAGSAGALWPA